MSPERVVRNTVCVPFRVDLGLDQATVVRSAAQDLDRDSRLDRLCFAKGQCWCMEGFLYVFHSLRVALSMCHLHVTQYARTTSQRSVSRKEFHMVTRVTSVTHRRRLLCCWFWSVDSQR